MCFSKAAAAAAGVLRSRQSKTNRCSARNGLCLDWANLGRELAINGRTRDGFWLIASINRRFLIASTQSRWRSRSKRSSSCSLRSGEELLLSRSRRSVRHSGVSVSEGRNQRRWFQDLAHCKVFVQLSRRLTDRRSNETSDLFRLVHGREYG